MSPIAIGLIATIVLLAIIYSYWSGQFHIPFIIKRRSVYPIEKVHTVTHTMLIDWFKEEGFDQEQHIPFVYRVKEGYMARIPIKYTLKNKFNKKAELLHIGYLEKDTKHVVKQVCFSADKSDDQIKYLFVNSNFVVLQ